MTRYSIAYIEQISGIKAHTLRIWEQRYGIITPERTDSNIRTYNDAQLQKILNISVLINSGYKIGQLSALPEEELNQLVLELQLKDVVSDEVYESFINNMIAFALSYDSEKFNSAYEQARRKFGFNDTYIHVIYPLLYRIGLLWSVNQMIPAQEHFASNLIRMKFFSELNSIPEPKQQKTWILFLPENEIHEIGLLFAAILLKTAGKKVVYLGQSVPDANLQQVAENLDTDGILCFIVSQLSDDSVQKFSHTLEKNFAGKSKVICSSSAVLQFIKASRKTEKIDSPRQFISWLNHITSKS